VTTSGRSLQIPCLKGLVGVLFGLMSRLAMAQGGPPLLTDDPGTPGNGKTELNVAFTTEKSRKEQLFEAPLFDINYGVGEHIQIKLEIPWLVRDEESERTRSGLGNVLLGFKWRFLDEKEDGVDASIYPQPDFNTAVVSRRSGLVAEGMELLLPVQVARDFGPVAVNVELGFRLHEEGEDVWVWGLALGRKVTDEIELLGEVHGEAARSFDRGKLVFNLGARWKLSELNSILVSAGRGIRGESRGEPSFIGYLGLQFNF
jgi:hypothetical protein